VIKETGDLPAAILLIVTIDDPDEALAAVRITSNALHDPVQLEKLIGDIDHADGHSPIHPTGECLFEDG
jgi:hypothetical protein